MYARIPAQPSRPPCCDNSDAHQLGGADLSGKHIVFVTCGPSKSLVQDLQ